MSKITIFFALFLSLIIIQPLGHAEWSELGSTDEITYYLDYERIRKKDGLVYYWLLVSYFKRSPNGDLSAIVHEKGDCDLFRYKIISDTYYEGSMA